MIDDKELNKTAKVAKKAYWLARSEHAYWVSANKAFAKKLAKDDSHPFNMSIAEFCADQFERATNFKMKEGEIAKVRFSVEYDDA